MEFSGGWQRSEPVERVLLEDADRRITWSCLAPNSTVEITSRGERWIGPSPASIAVSVSIALVYAFAMGVDFPGSNRRFARLA